MVVLRRAGFHRSMPLGRVWWRWQAAYSNHQPHKLFWWIRLGCWVALAAPLALFTNPWFAPLGPVAFETALFTGVVLARRRSRSQPGAGGGGHDWRGDPDADVREPRNPYPLAGAGAVALPLPESPPDLAAGLSAQPSLS